MYTNKTKGSESLQRLREAAHKLGIECLDTEWLGAHGTYRLRCACGHEYTRTPAAILKHGRGCPECLNRTRLARLHTIAEQHGGRCLETHYLGNNALYRFACAKGHEWSNYPDRLRSGGFWCPRCARMRYRQLKLNPNGLEQLQEAAKARGGVCLSDLYEGRAVHYRFRCAEGHEWETGAKAILSSSAWCPRCSFAKLGAQRRTPNALARLQALARAKGGKCLSLQYVDQNTKYHMRCAAGHEWWVVGSCVLRGMWCRNCYFDTRRDTLENMQTIAHARGGRCLSTVYLSCRDKLTWECHRGHTWRAVPSSIKVGSWCPSCAPMNRITDSKSKARLKYLKKG